MSWCDEHGTDGGCSECADEYWKKQLQTSQEEIQQLKADNKKKKNRIGILNRSLRRLKKGGE